MFTLNLNYFYSQNYICATLRLRGGWNVEFHYYDRPFFSEHRKLLFSWSLLQHQNVKSVFLVDHNYKIDKDQNIQIDKDHYYKSSWSLLQKSERWKEWKEHWKSQFCLIFEFWQSYFTYGVSTYGVLALTNKSLKTF